MKKVAENLSSRADFFESSVEQLKKDLPKYLSSHADLKRPMRTLSSTLKNVAATESHPHLKEVLFAFAEKQQMLSELDLFEQCSEEALMALDEAKSGVLQPIRDIVNDYTQAVTKLEATSKGKNTPELIHEQRVYQAEDALPIHARMFDRFRVSTLKAIVQNILTTQLRMHCRAVEELSTVLEALGKIDVDTL